MGTESTESTEILKQKLNQQIDSAREKLEALKKDVASLHAEDIETLQQRREELQKRLEERKERTKKLQADIQSWKKEKIAHTREAIGSWRKQRELQKLQSRAERAEVYAIDLVNVAAFDFEEAEQAILDALAARYDADMAEAPQT
jgi:peptidoglycan hydrolase CwlO-like protein